MMSFNSKLWTFLLTVCLWASVHSTLAQTNVLPKMAAGSINAPDSSEINANTLLPEAFLLLVYKYHPVARQAQLFQDAARQELRAARGQFDPKISSEYDLKQYNDKEYYRIWDSKLKIPLISNTDLTVGYERTDGLFLNPENDVPQQGLIKAGITVPIGKGLFTDERRATLRKAQLLSDLAAADQAKELNKLLFTAQKDYWNWFEKYQTLKLIENGVALAQRRFNLIRQEVFLGDAAALDSIQAMITLQERTMELFGARVEYTNATAIINTWLWGPDQTPRALIDETHPIAITPQVVLPSALWLEELKSSALTVSPELNKMRIKGRQLEIDQRLARENLKPGLDLTYYLLNQPTNNTPSEWQGILPRTDYSLGVNFSFPLFLRKERAKVQLTQIKLEQNQYDIDWSSRRVTAAVDTAVQSLQAMRGLWSQQNQMLQYYERMLQGEQSRFRQGESSLFLVISWEDKNIEARIKLISFNVKYQKALATLLYAAGTNPADYGPPPGQ